MPSINQFKYINLLFLLSHWLVHTSQSWENIFNLYLKNSFSGWPWATAVSTPSSTQYTGADAKTKENRKFDKKEMSGLGLTIFNTINFTYNMQWNIKIQSKVVLKSFAAANSVRSSNTAYRSGGCFLKTNKLPICIFSIISNRHPSFCFIGIVRWKVSVQTDWIHKNLRLSKDSKSL